MAHRGVAQPARQFELPGQDYLRGLAAVAFKVGEQTEVLQRVVAQCLRFINQDRDSLAQRQVNGEMEKALIIAALLDRPPRTPSWLRILPINS